MKNNTACHLTHALLIGLALLTTVSASAQETQPPAPRGSGFTDPQVDPPRPATTDVEPVYRGPAIDTLATVRKRGVLRVGVSAVDPMVMHNDKDALEGFSVDLSRQLASDMGVEVEFVETSWSRIIPDLLARRFDVIVTGLWVTPVRALMVNFTDATAIEGLHLIANRKLAGTFKTREEFNRPEVRIAVYAGTVQEQVVRNLLPHATVVKVEGDDSEVDVAVDGKAHAALVATFAPKAQVAQAADRIFLPFGEPLQSTSTAMAVRKGDADFLNYLNSWLVFQKSSGWIEARTKHWADPANWPK